MYILVSRGVVVIVVVLVLLASITAPGAAKPQEDDDAVDASLAAALDEAGVPGGTMAVVTRSQMRVSSAGREAGGDELNPTAQMLWGSVSKPLAAATVVRLAREGRLDLDDPAIDYVPETGEQEDPVVRSITIRQFLNHTSGLPFGADHLDVDDAEREPEEVISSLPQMTLLARPGKAYSYSSLGYVIVQAVAEAAGGSNLSRLESRYFPGVGRTESLSRGARFVGASAVPWPAGHDGAGLGYGYQGGSIEALGGFIGSSFSEPGDSVFDEMTARPVDAGGNGKMGLGWRLRDDGVVWHTGTVPGYFSAVHIDRDREIGVAVTMNASGLLHESELLALSQRLFDEARGVDSQVSSGGASALPVLIPVIAAVLAAAAILVGAVVRVRRRYALIWAGAALATAGIGWLALPALFEAPARYVWLWMPGVGLVFVVLPLVFAGVSVWWCARSRPAEKDAEVLPRVDDVQVSS